MQVLKTWTIPGLNGSLSVAETVPGDRVTVLVREEDGRVATVDLDFDAWKALGELAYGVGRAYYDGPAIREPETEGVAA